MAKFDRSAEPSDSDLKEELRGRLLSTLSVRGLAGEIADILNKLGKNPGTRERVGTVLANELFAKFAKPNREVEQLIENRPRQLHALLQEIVWEEIQTFIKGNPEIFRRGKRRVRVTTEEEKIRRTKASKNRYEHDRRSHITTPGWIEREFGGSGTSALAGLIHQIPLGAPCLDSVFHGGTVKMCDDRHSMYSLQSLFGLSRKKLSAAGPGIRRGRETVYNYKDVLLCIDDLLKQNRASAQWLPDMDRRRTVLTGILSRAQQQAPPKIREAFEKTLGRYLN